MFISKVIIYIHNCVFFLNQPFPEFYFNDPHKSTVLYGAPKGTW